MQCPRCNQSEVVKAGFVRQTQRYKCKGCKYFFTGVDRRKYPRETKVRAIQLYLEGLGFRAIERLLGVCDTTVLLWVKDLGKTIQELEPLHPAKIELLELDEIHHFVGQKNKLSGYGLLVTVPGDDTSPSRWVAVQSGQPKPFGKNLNISMSPGSEQTN
jgi:transposase-like protein